MARHRPKSIRLRGHIRKWRDRDSLKSTDIASEPSRLREALPISVFGRVLNRVERNHLTEPSFQGAVWKAWQEAWIAREFARVRRATHLQLADENEPDDFYVRSSDHDWIGFQVTEALLGGRQRSREYRERAESGRAFEEVDHRAIMRESGGAIPAILNALNKKAGKHSHLVIYWNTGWLIDARRFIMELERDSAPYRALFVEAWIIGKGSVFRVAPDFKMLSGPPTSFRK
jgi:hypothetical protein